MALVSCAKKEQTKASVNIDFFSSALSDSFPGGVIILAQNMDTNIQVLKAAPEAAEGFLLDNGPWRFAVIAWDGVSGKFTGTPYCAKQDVVSLDGDDITLDFSTTPEQCMNEDLFGVTEYNSALGLIDTSGYHFQTITIKPCGSVSTPAPPFDPLTPPVSCQPTSYQSYRIGFKTMKQDGTLGPAIFSNCFVDSGINPIDTSIQLPIGSLDPTEPKFKYVIEAFTQNSSCAGEPAKVYTLRKGLKPDVQMLSEIYPKIEVSSGPTGSTYIYLRQL